MANIFDANESIAQYLTQFDKFKELSDSQVEYFKEYGADYMQYLFKLEENLEWAARPITESCLDAIRDIDQISDNLSLKAITLYMAIVYFAGIVSKNPNEEKTIARSCLFVSSKMEEGIPPSLSDYEDYGISQESILDAETKILIAGWKNMVKISPFHYLFIFFTALKQSTGFSHFVKNAESLILGVAGEVVLKGERPSNVAFAATVILVHGPDLGNDFVDSVIDEVGLGERLVKESVFSCYNLMNEKRKKVDSLQSPEEEKYPPSS